LLKPGKLDDGELEIMRTHARQGEEIPLEARIVAVADVFDALTSRRSYKDAWSNETAIATLQELAGESLDQDCVEALVSNLSEVEEIQRRFRET
jgi:HD-GYP domain-containing protein (c-di-GMP phosphodiesterase class II)